MGNPTLSTRVSRRSMLAGGVAVMAMPMPTSDTLPVAGPPQFGGRRADAVLLRRIAAAHDCLADYRQADAERSPGLLVWDAKRPRGRPALGRADGADRHRRRRRALRTVLRTL